MTAGGVSSSRTVMPAEDDLGDDPGDEAPGQQRRGPGGRGARRRAPSTAAATATDTTPVIIRLTNSMISGVSRNSEHDLARRRRSASPGSRGPSR